MLTRRGLPRLSGRVLDERDVPERTPFLISPALEYDVDLNRYFLVPAMAGGGETRGRRRRDVCRFPRFLDESRDGRPWRDAGKDDHAAYLHWRRFDPAGPRVAASTRNRELAMASGFFAWSGRACGGVIPSRCRPPVITGGRAPGAGLWRDCGLRAYQAGGLRPPRQPA